MPSPAAARHQAESGTRPSAAILRDKRTQVRRIASVRQVILGNWPAVRVRGESYQSPIATCSPQIFSLGRCDDGPSGSVDQAHHDRLRRLVGADRRSRLPPAHPYAGGPAWPACVGRWAHALVGRRDDRGRLNAAAGRLAVWFQRVRCRGRYSSSAAWRVWWPMWPRQSLRGTAGLSRRGRRSRSPLRMSC